MCQLKIIQIKEESDFNMNEKDKEQKNEVENQEENKEIHKPASNTSNNDENKSAKDKDKSADSSEIEKSDNQTPKDENKASNNNENKDFKNKAEQQVDQDFDVNKALKSNLSDTSKSEENIRQAMKQGQKYRDDINKNRDLKNGKKDKTSFLKKIFSGSLVNDDGSYNRMGIIILIIVIMLVVFLSAFLNPVRKPLSNRHTESTQAQVVKVDKNAIPTYRSNNNARNILSNVGAAQANLSSDFSLLKMTIIDYNNHKNLDTYKSNLDNINDNAINTMNNAKNSQVEQLNSFKDAMSQLDLIKTVHDNLINLTSSKSMSSTYNSFIGQQNQLNANFINDMKIELSNNHISYQETSDGNLKF